MALALPEPDAERSAAQQPAEPPRGFREHYRYSRWDGRQRVDDLDADRILDALSDDLMAEGDLAAALRRLLRRGLEADPERGGERVSGTRELLERLARARRDLLRRYQLGDVMKDVRERLKEVVDTERRGLERRLAEARAAEADPELRRMLGQMAGRRVSQLEALPEDAGARIRALQDYDFLEPEARERFEALLDELRHQVLDRQFQGLADQIKGMTPDSLAANRAMVRELDRLLQERLEGGDPDATDFLSRHGAFFPGARTLDDVIDQLTERMAAMQALLASMSPEQRAELQSLTDALLRDDRLRWDLAQLAATLDQLLPGGLGQRVTFRGDEPLSLDGALHQLNELQAMDRLADRLDGAEDVASLAGIDPDEVRRLAGEEAAEDLESLQRIAEQLEQAGYVERRGGTLELTPRGTRRIGQRVLDELFSRLRDDAHGNHAIRRGGAGGERAEASVAWEFGRPFDLDLRATLGNALTRPENGPRRWQGGLRLAPADFTVHESEELSTAATVLLVDMSRSMLLRGCFLAAKKVAVALDTLIRTQFPRDELHVIGFAYYAREIRPGSLAALSWHGYEYGTNLQHGLLLARRLLARSRAHNREIVVVTDGEPTAHFEGGQVEFSYPPTRRTIQATLAEVARCTKDGIVINTFMLERSRALADFVARLTRLNRGRAFYATPERLGEYVLVDYVGRKTNRV
ncbi:MAG TPA: VWA domain-containing protein [Candidatus Limnocylindrales bacterium]|nr:VWA domain-containing protein [Candidatus Limnocylindrales bacterium]